MATTQTVPKKKGLINFDFLQKLGKVLMTVIAVMPAAGLMISLGKLVQMGGGDIAAVMTIVSVMEGMKAQMMKQFSAMGANRVQVSIYSWMYDADGNDVYLKDIWPTNAEVAAVVDGSVSREMFLKDYASVFDGDHRWKGLDVPEGELFAWNDKSTYVRKQTFFDGMKATPDPVADIHGARVLALLGDSVTTDHISPAGAFKASSPAGKYLTERGVEPKNFNSYGSRRGNHEIMVRGTFGNIRLRNQLLASVGEEVTPGGFTYDFLAKKPTTIFEASRDYIDNKVPLVVLAGKEYGTGSSRDWAAKGTVMLGVKAVITESFERIHRSNLIGMGVLPLQFPAGESYESLGLNGTETYDIAGVEKLNEGVTPKTVHVTATHEDGSKTEFDAVVRIDTPGEADYYRNGGILQYVLRDLIKG